MLALKFLGRLRDVGLLILRVGVGVCFVIHGSGKIFGGPVAWTEVGQAIGVWGITQYPIAWGFMAAFSEFAGGIFFVLGFLFRPAAILMAITMAVATSMHLHKGDGFNVYSHALELGLVFVGMIFIGPGKISIDRE